MQVSKNDSATVASENGDEKLGPRVMTSYPWLDFDSNPILYLPPSEYSRLLRPYTSGGLSDLDLFKKFLQQLPTANRANILEIGAGTGRATEVLLSCFSPKLLHVLDQSPRMLRFLDVNLSCNCPMALIESDAIAFMSQARSDQYDLVFSLWSLSHSIHQNLSRFGLARGKELVTEALLHFIASTLNRNGVFYIVHFDSMSHEQKMIIRQRKRLLPFLGGDLQSPSKQLLDGALEMLHSEGKVDWNCTHYAGDPIIYPSLGDALESIMNSHAEGLLNKRLDTAQVISELSDELLACRKRDGTFAVKPAWFVYEARRLV